MHASTEVPIAQCPCISWIFKSPEGVRSVLLVVCQIDPPLTISFKYLSNKGPCDSCLYLNYLNIIARTVLAIHCSCSIIKNGTLENAFNLGQLCQPFIQRTQINCAQVSGSLRQMDVADKCLWSTIRSGWLPRGLSYMQCCFFVC